MGGLTTLNLNTLELTSILEKAPYNGAPSSQDYNDSWTNALVDLSTITGFINDTLIQILNSLPATAANGLTGATLVSDPNDQSALFFNSLTNSPLVVADSMRVLLAQLNALAVQLTDLNVQITSIQTQVGSTNQTGILPTVQALSQIVNSLSQTVSQLSLTVTAQGATIAGLQSAPASSSNFVVTASVGGAFESLPDAHSSTSLFIYVKTDADVTGAVTVNTVNGQTINGFPYALLENRYQYIQLSPYFGNWLIVGGN